eukprot:Lankesteria_metandrocarpae@DN5284_c0_g1_i1.p1
MPPELFKRGGLALVDTLHTLLCDTWDGGEIPGVLVPIFKKKGNRVNPTNYRGTVLIPVASKVLARIIQKRMSDVLDAQISECQYVFCKGRGTTGMLFAARLLIEKGCECMRRQQRLSKWSRRHLQADKIVNRWMECPPNYLNVVA